MTDQDTHVTAGVDTHRDTHTAAVLDQQGRLLDTATFATTRVGYQQLVTWIHSYGTIASVGVEGTGSYGAGLTRYLTNQHITVIEVGRPNRQHRRRHGKSDATDAISAARAVQSGEATGKPRGTTGPTEALRAIRVARNGAVKARSAAINELKALLVTAPNTIRRNLATKSTKQLIATTTNLRPGPDLTDPNTATKLAMRSLAQRITTLTNEISHLTEALDDIVTATAPPALLAECGIGTIIATDLLITYGSNTTRLKTEASFAAICGVSAIDASSGLQQRHRLNRGGDRQANAALYRAVIVRLRYHQPTRDYMTQRLTEGKTKREIIRCLKRYLARTTYNTLTHQQPTRHL
ncbi:MAG: IS110 family transposase [bacterium]|nr:IS110 family transposase [bacterium]